MHEATASIHTVFIRGDTVLHRFIVISGCSGGGKSALVAELGRRGHAVVEEPGRRIVEEERKGAGRALPWVDLAAFARRAIDLARKDRQAAEAADGWVFFDRSLVDAAAALEHATGQPMLERLCRGIGYDRRVFFAPPWPEIFSVDDARRHGIDEAMAEYERLLAAYSRLGYEIAFLPRIAVAERAEWLVAQLRKA